MNRITPHAKNLVGSPDAGLGVTGRRAPSGVLYQRGFLLPNAYMLIGAAAIAGLIAIGAYSKGRESGVEKYHEYRTEVEAASAKADAEHQAKLEEALRNTGDVAAIYSRFYTELAAGNRNSRLNGMLPAGCDRKAESSNAETARLVAAATEERGTSSETYEAACSDIERNSAADALQLMWLQTWVLKVCR